jgi:hypothetical protein
VIYRYAGQQDSSVEESQNRNGKNMQWMVSEGSTHVREWGTIPQPRLPDTTGSIVVVNRTENDTDARKVKAMCRLVQKQLVSLLGR